MVPELLAPAGNLEKLHTAAKFGADAVYMGLDGFSLRNRAGNVTVNDLRKTVRIARDLGVRFYLAVNLVALDSDLMQLKEQIPEIVQAAPDAVIVSDPGIVDLFRRNAPKISVHLSTQANVTNSGSAEFWFQQGVSRIILARELNLGGIRTLKDRCSGELEAFVHGALCISWSGRCFLSRYMADRDANRGDCAQSCRWSYRVLEESRRPGEFFPVESDERGSYILNARDLCALPVLDDVVDTGVHSLKLEGRMKSVHYVAVVVDVYRTALDLIGKGDRSAFREKIPEMLEELKRVSNRGFTLNAFGNLDHEETLRPDTDRYENADAFVGSVTGTTDKGPAIALRNKIEPGESITFVEPGFRRTGWIIRDILDTENQVLTHGRTGSTVILPVGFSVEEGAIVRR